MSTTSHAAAGAVIALLVNKPLLALPLAFASHFLMDMVPHYGFQRAGFHVAIKHKLTFLYAVLDIIGVAFLVYMVQGSSWLVYACGFVSALPDIVWPYRYFIKHEGRGRKVPASWLTRFHRFIEWCEYPWGMPIDVAISIGLLFTISKLQ